MLWSNIPNFHVSPPTTKIFFKQFTIFDHAEHEFVELPIPQTHRSFFTILTLINIHPSLINSIRFCTTNALKITRVALIFPSVDKIGRAQGKNSKNSRQPP